MVQTARHHIDLLNGPDIASWTQINTGFSEFDTSAALASDLVSHTHDLSNEGGPVTRGNALVVTGGLTVQTSGIAVTGNSLINGTLGGVTTLSCTTIGATTITSITVNAQQVNASGVLSNGYVSAGPLISGQPGDITANRSNNTGYVWLGNSSHYIGFDGTNYVLPNAGLWVQGTVQVVNVYASTSGTSLADLTVRGLTNFQSGINVTAGGAVIVGTLFVNGLNVNGGLANVITGTLAVSGTLVVSSALSAPSATFNSFGAVCGPASSMYHVETGAFTYTGITNGEIDSGQINFARAFGAIPRVLISQFKVGTDPYQHDHYVTNATTTWFSMKVLNASGLCNCTFDWIAFGT